MRTESRFGHAIQFGAVYFRKTNPPREDWARDYVRAAEDGHTIFRHWVPWGAVEVRPGEFDWADYDRHLELGEKHRIDTVLAEMIINAPEWLYHRHPHARMEDRHGRKSESGMHVSCVTGGAHSMCLDNPEVAEAAGKFLSELAKRYRGHPAFYGYDVWNECSFYGPGLMCFCPATQAVFREWLKEKYGDLKALGEAWFRYSFSSWDDVAMPRTVGPYPDVFDTIEFHNWNAFRWMKWRVDALKAADPDHPVCAHGNGKSHCDIAPACGDDWRAGELVDVFGYTYWFANNCHPLMAGDMIRSASRGKRFWRAEAIGNVEWNGRRAGRGRDLTRERMADPANIRIDALMSFAAGARGYLNPRWRPLLDGPLFGAYGWYGMDGSRTDRSEMAAQIAKWANDPGLSSLWAAAPVRGDVGLLLLEEAQAWCYAQYGSTEYYSDCLKGAYEAFLDANVQADVVRIDQIDEYPLVYVPFPVAMSDSTADRIRSWVGGGGCLVGEGCFGYFTERGHAMPDQPNRGFADVFGCTEESVSFGPDMWGELKFRTGRGRVRGGMFRQSYRTGNGRAKGWFERNRVALVENRFGAGRARIVGTMPGYGYLKRRDAGTRKWAASLPDFAGRRQLLRVGSPGVVARLAEGPSGRFVWALNCGERARTVTIRTDGDRLRVRAAEPVRGRRPSISGAGISVRIEGRDAAVFEIR